jgi:T-complex protein 1 subunit gamma
MNRGAPVIVVNSTPRQESVREIQIQNIDAAKTVADVIRTCLGPRAMLKMIFRCVSVFIYV